MPKLNVVLKFVGQVFLVSRGWLDLHGTMICLVASLNILLY
jgi:hypothetical protein